MKKVLFIAVFLFGTSICINAQKCNVQGVVQYIYNDYIGFKPDTGSEVMFIKYSSTHKVPNRQKWETYHSMVEKWIKFDKSREYLRRDEALEYSGYKQGYKDSIQTLGAELLLERITIESEGLIKYSTVVDASGKFDINVPYGTYYILIKSKNRKLTTGLEFYNRYYMVRTVLNTPTKIVSYEFDIPRGYDNY